MAIELAKRGSKIDLSKKDPTLNEVNVALGWDVNRFNTGGDFDLDVSAFLLNSSGKAKDEGDFIFYSNPKHSSGSVIHSGDNRVGDADGDDEVIKVFLDKVPSDIEKIAFVITIYEHEQRGQNFGMVSNSYVRVDNGKTDEKLIRFDLGEDFSTETGVLVCELYRHNGNWKFSAVGQGYNNGLAGFVKDYGLQVK